MATLSPAQRTSVARPEPQDLSDTVAGLLGQFGLVDADTRDSIVDIAQRHVADLGLDAQVESVRYGVVHVACDGQTATLMHYVTDELLDRLRDEPDLDVDRVNVRVRP